jgi:hypothetical protein
MLLQLFANQKLRTEIHTQVIMKELYFVQNQEGYADISCTGM